MNQLPPDATLVDIDLTRDLNQLLAIEQAVFGAEAYRARDLYYFTGEGFKLRGVADKGRILGYCMFNPDWKQLHIGNLAVLTEFQKHGVGQKLFDEMLRLGVEAGCESAHLEVARNNEKAIRFYVRNQFVENGVRRHYYPDGQDALLMARNLKPAG